MACLAATAVAGVDSLGSRHILQGSQCGAGHWGALRQWRNKGDGPGIAPSFEPEGDIYRGGDLLLCTLTVSLGWWLRKTVVESGFREGKFWCGMRVVRPVWMLGSDEMRAWMRAEGTGYAEVGKEFKLFSFNMKSITD